MKHYNLNTIYVVVFVSFIIGCSTTKEHTNFKFRDKYHLQQPTSLRTDGIYLQETHDVNYKGIAVSGYSYYRFYPNGRCYYFIWRRGTPPDSMLQTTSKEYGERTFFKNIGDSIAIESWGGHYISYVYKYGLIKGKENILTITSYQPRGISTAKQNLSDNDYQFKSLTFSDTAANW